MDVTRKRSSNCAIRKGKSKKKVGFESKPESENNPITSPKDSKIQEIATNRYARPKKLILIIIITDSDGTKKKEHKKKHKWKPVPLSECGFNLSLLPRPSRPEMFDPEEEAAIIENIEKRVEHYQD